MDDPKRVAKALALIADGWFVEHAVCSVQIPIRTWEDRVRNDPALAQRVMEARSEGERAHLTKGRDDVDNGRSPSFEQWLLERMNPRRYRPPPAEQVVRTVQTAEERAREILGALDAAAADKPDE